MDRVPEQKEMIKENGSTSRGGLRWYVVQCNPLKELQAAHALRSYLGLNVYLPQVSKRVRAEKRPMPFFPGYLFVQADLAEVQKSRINATPCVMRLLEFGGGPRPLGDRTVQALRERVDALNAQGGMPPHNFRPGDAVRLTGGPLRGLEAVFLGPMTPGGRVQVLLEFLGRPNKVGVDMDYLERTHNIPPAGTAGAIAAAGALMERRTRGKGRRISGHRDE